MLGKAEINKALSEIKQAKNPVELEKLRQKYIGRKGIITKELRRLGDLASSKRAEMGRQANLAKSRIENAFSASLEKLMVESTNKITDMKIDVTAPVGKRRHGNLHPVMEIEKELIVAFWQLGFSIAEGPEIETDWYNFEALNIPADHPARDMQDTFYIEGGMVPRTHTSSVQIRHMESKRPPIRIISPGRVYRNEDEDATHIWAFHQLEGLVVDKNITLADLKGVLSYMVKSIFGGSADVKFLPSFFPYTEPSLEIHARLDAKSPWLELAGAGMVHPKVLQNVGIDSSEYSGFAFGVGLERLAAIRHGVDDIRYFWRPDLRFMRQF